jgi:regulator of sirC expression with transglutaminase-like and TPR domain
MEQFVPAGILAHATVESPAFAALAGREDPPLLPLAALVAEGLATVDIALLERHVDFLAYLVQRAAGEAEHPQDRLAALARVLADEEGFRGLPGEDFDDAAGSYLNRVFEARHGLPITLAVLYLAVGERLGWPLVGVDFPLRFLVRYRYGQELLVIDPFDGGRLLTMDDCARLLRPGMERVPEAHLRHLVRLHLESLAEPRRVAVRMLKNLESCFVRAQDYDGARNTIGKLLLLHPDAVGELRDLGEVYHLLGEHAQALDCLREYLAQAPRAADRVLVQQFMHHIETMLAAGEEGPGGGG